MSYYLEVCKLFRLFLNKERALCFCLAELLSLCHVSLEYSEVYRGETTFHLA